MTKPLFVTKKDSCIKTTVRGSCVIATACGKGATIQTAAENKASGQRRRVPDEVRCRNAANSVHAEG